MYLLHKYGSICCKISMVFTKFLNLKTTVKLTLDKLNHKKKIKFL